MPPSTKCGNALLHPPNNTLCIYELTSSVPVMPDRAAISALSGARGGMQSGLM